MANILIEEATMQAIANSIRGKNGSTDLYLPEEMPAAIDAIEGGGGGGAEPVLIELSVVENGVYVPGAGIDGYSSVTVNVPSAGIESGVVVNEKDANNNWLDVTVYGEFPTALFQDNTTIKRVEVVNATTIATYAFDGCTALESVVLPNTLLSIGTYAFNGCTKLSQANLPSSLQSIGAYAFYDCTALASVNIPASVSSVGNRAFRGCTGIISVVWNPVALQSIAGSSYPAFQGCTNIRSVEFADGVTHVPSFIFLDAAASLGDVVLPESITYIGERAFYGCGITSVNIPAATASVGARSFGNCTSLASVQWSALSIASVGSSTYPIFGGCSALKEFVIADGVVILPSYILKNCSGIESVIVPNSVSSLGTQAMYNCAALASVQIGTSDACQIASIATNAFSNDAALTNIAIYKTADAVSGSPWGASSATINWML